MDWWVVVIAIVAAAFFGLLVERAIRYTVGRQDEVVRDPSRYAQKPNQSEESP